MFSHSRDMITWENDEKTKIKNNDNSNTKFCAVDVGANDITAAL